MIVVLAERTREVQHATPFADGCQDAAAGQSFSICLFLYNSRINIESDSVERALAQAPIVVTKRL